MNKLILIISLVVSTIISTQTISAQKKRTPRTASQIVPNELFSGLKYRNIGPFRGGRVAAVTGVPGFNELFYMGSTGGGVWKTSDRGESWENISDGFFGGTIGAIDVSVSDRNIIYAAGGEKTVRGNVSHGYGIWKSVDAGETWEYTGLSESQYIPRVRIHPSNPDIVYAAVLGHIFGPNSERGVYRTVDGGKNWEKILFIDENTGAVDLILDPTNPRIIYASTWRVRRTPYSLESGGAGSAIWKSRDGGNSWDMISDNPGMPPAPIGISGITLSGSDNKIIYALIEAAEGGLYVSNNGGDSWARVNDDRNLRQRAWYYTRLYADPADENTIYVLNVGFHKSVDGGRTFERIATPHGDHHDLWIDPHNSMVMIIGDDGGAQVTVDGGKRWSSLMNQPTGQFYRVTTDNHYPYRIYGAQQDNSTVRIASRTFSGGISENDWENTAGGESGWIAPDPLNENIVYGGSYGGLLQRYNHLSGESRMVDIWPDNPMGWGADSLIQRFQWNFPILFSRHDPGTLYAASNMLFMTDNEGQSWKQISPDLTRNDKSRMGSSGGPITKDNTSVEYYGTIFTVAESAFKAGVIWCGTDDGLVKLTENGGETWIDVTPPRSVLPEWTQINSIEADPFNQGGLYIAATAYKNDNFTPYLFKTSDYGKNWELITGGIDKSHFTRVIRADSERKGLLYCGTESGVYISFDDGNMWQPFQLNLPVVPVTDMVVKGNDLIIATQGRAFWIFDHLDLIRELDSSVAEQPVTVFDPAPIYRDASGRSRTIANQGENPVQGAVIRFYLNTEPAKDDSCRIDIFDNGGVLVKSFRTDLKGFKTGPHTPYTKLEISKGINIISWDLLYPGVMPVEGMILWGGNLRGPKALPGTYRAELTYNNFKTEVNFEILLSPVSSSGIEDIKEQFDFITGVRDKLNETHQAIIEIRAIREDIRRVSKNLTDKTNNELKGELERAASLLDSVEQELYQTKNRSSQDPLNFPIKLGNKLASLNGVVATGDFRPTNQAYMVRDYLITKIDYQLNRYYNLRETVIPGLNSKLRESGTDYLKY